MWVLLERRDVIIEYDEVYSIKSRRWYKVLQCYIGHKFKPSTRTPLMRRKLKKNLNSRS